MHRLSDPAILYFGTPVVLGQFFGLGEILHPSTLAEIPEAAYRPRPQAASAGSN
jgi:hypothetical protein